MADHPDVRYEDCTLTTSSPAVRRLPRRRLAPELARPLLLAHRGFALDGAENTLRAFRDSLNLGASALETDVRVTRDGFALAFHDGTLERVMGDRRRVADLDRADISALRVRGIEPIPLLSDVLAEFPRASVNIDVKEPRAIRAVAEAVVAAGAEDRVSIAAFSSRRSGRCVREIERAHGRRPVRAAGPAAIVALLLLAAAPLPDRVLGLAARAVLGGIDVLQVPPSHRGRSVVTSRFVRAAHLGGTEVHVWEVDDAYQATALLDLGVDGLITNRIDILRPLVDARLD